MLSDDEILKGDAMIVMADPRPVRERVAEFLRGEVTRRTFRPPAVPACADVALWTRNAWAGQQVAGERAHLEALRAVVGSAHRSEGGEHRAVAVLVPEPNNRFDPDAVAVHIDGQRIGYLPREDAPRYRPALDRIYASGRRPTVTARIWAADYEDWDAERDTTVTRFSAGVHLALDEPHLLLPVNAAPAEPHVLLPHGSTMQVHDTAPHLDRLATIPALNGERWVHATLHHLTEQLPRSTRDVVEVRVDGERVGKLTPKMSGDVLPAVRFLTDRGRVATARLLVSGNRAAVTVTLYVVRAHQLDDRWFDEV
jgi:collagen type III alpha